jgi:hypothetical protein
MRSTTSKAILGAALWLAMAMTAARAGAGALEASGQGGLRLELTLGDQFSLHEPIIAVLHLQNDSGHTAQLDLGLNHRGALVFTFTQPDGRQVVRHLPEDFDGFGEIGEVTLKPGESYHEGLVLNDWQLFDQVGTYQYQVTIAASGQPGARPAPALSAAGSFRVTPADARLLAAACGRLATVALGRDAAAAREAAHALSFASDEACLPALLQARAGCFICRDDVLLALARIGTPQAARGVADAWRGLDEHSRKTAVADFTQAGKAPLLNAALQAVKP